MKKLGLMLACLLLLTGCTGASREIQRAMALRGQLLRAAGCSFDAAITADYGQELYQFRMRCQADAQGNVDFTVTQPDTIAGITGTICQGQGNLTFSDTALEFPLMADDQLSPVSAPWVFVRTLRSGCLTAACQEGPWLHVSMDDRYEEDALSLDIWLDGQDLPQRGEILYDGRRILSLDVENFQIQ